MTPENRSGDDSIRPSVDRLTQSTETARHEIDDVAGTIRASIEQITQIATSSLPRHEATALESALGDTAQDMLRTVGHLEEQVTAAISAEVTDLATLLRPDTCSEQSGRANASPTGCLPSQPLSDDQDLRELTLRDGTVVTLGLHVSDPLGWTPHVTVDERPAVDDNDTKSRIDRIAAILAKDGNSLAGGIEEALPYEHAEDSATDTLAPSPGAGVIVTATVILKLIQGAIQRHRRSRSRRHDPEEDQPHA